MRLKDLVARGVALTFIGAVVAICFATGADSKAKVDPAVSAYCTTLGEAQVTYAPCKASGQSIFTVDGPPIGTNDVGEYTSIAIGGDGFPIMSYRDVSAGALKVAKCTDIECRSKRTVTTINDPDDVGFFTSIAIGTDGLPVLSYVDNDAFTLKVAKCNDAACKGADETISSVDSDVGVNTSSHRTSLAIGTDGLPVIAYYDGQNQSLKVAKCNDPACAGTNETITRVVDTADIEGSFSSLAVGDDGDPVISFVGGSMENLKVVKCNDPACAPGGEVTTTVDAGSFIGGDDSIAIGADNNPVIAYQGPSNVLNVIKCNDRACAPGGELTTTVVATNASFMSVAIGTDGRPVISYHDGFAGALMFVRCNDPACRFGDETITTVDAVPVAGRHSAIAIGIDGRPIISYEGGSALKVARISA